MRIGRELLKGHLPTLVLAILAEKPLHGYALCKVIQQRAGNALKVGEGTLYPLLYRLEEQGLVESKWVGKSNQRPRKVYHVTRKGKRFLQKQKTEWAVLFKLVETIMGKVGAT